MGQPDIIVFNAGLHLLHIIGEREDPQSGMIETGRNRKLPTYQAFSKYERLMQFYFDQALKLHPKAILVKTTNRICEEYWYGIHAELARAYNAKDPQTIDFCKNHVQQKSNGTLTPQEINEVCTAGILTAKGSNNLNARLNKMMIQMQIQNEMTNNVTIGIFPDDQVQTCEFTNDSRHYLEIAPSRINLLANILDCIL